MLVCFSVYFSKYSFKNLLSNKQELFTYKISKTFTLQ